MRKRLHFLGKLSPLAPEVIEVDAASVQEALAIAVQLNPNLSRLTSVKDKIWIQVAGFETDEDYRKPTQMEDLYIFPSMVGAGGGGRILFGAALIGISLATFGTGFAAAGYTSMWAAAQASTMGSLLISVGVSSIIGGLMTMISPAPSRDNGADSMKDPDASRYLGAGRNTTKSGTPIGKYYGTCKVYGQWFSLVIQAEDVTVAT